MTRKRKRSPLLVAVVLLLVLIPAALLAARNPGKAQAQWFDPNWGYRTKIDVANSSGSTQTDFQVLVATDTATLVTAGKMQATCNDLRVTDNSGKLLNYWIEPNTCNTTSTQIWVKVPSIPTSGIPIYLYYGNPSALPANYKTTDVFIKELSGSIASWPLDDTTTTQSYARVVNPTQATGRNLVINGTFDADVSWTKDATATITGGVGVMTATPNATIAFQQSINAINGKTYQITFTVVSLSAGGVSVGFIGAPGTARGVGTWTENIVSTGTNLVVYGRNSNTTATVDNIIVTQVNVPSSGTSTNLFTDGNMETSGVTAWTNYGGNGVLSKQTTNPHGGSQVIRVTYGTGAVTYALQNNILTTGKIYRVSGYARGDGTVVPNIGGNNGILWTGTTSTVWQPFDFVFTAQTNPIGGYVAVGCQTNSSTHYVEFDDVTVTEDTITRPDELTVDGNMDAADVNSWSTVTNATISKQTVTRFDSTSGQVLRVAYNGSLNPYTHMIGQNLVIGKTYHMTGWARSDGASTVPKFNDNVTYQWVGSASNTWQYIDITFVSTGTTLGFQGINGSGGYTEWDNISVTEVPPIVGKFDNTNGIPTTKKPTLGSASGGHLSTAYSFNAANSQYVNIYSSDLNSAFNPNEGTFFAWIKVSGSGVWSDNTLRSIAEIRADSNNVVQLFKNDGANSNQLGGVIVFGGTVKLIQTANTSTNWIQVVLTWSKSSDQTKVYINGSQVGSTLTGLGTWSGNVALNKATIGTLNGTGNPWSGLINDVHLYNRALSATEIASLYSGSVDLQSYTTSNYTGKELVRKFNSGITTTPSYAEENSLGPAAYWKFDDGSGTSALDSSGNGNTGVLSGSTKPTWATEDQCISGKCLSYNGTSSYVLASKSYPSSAGVTMSYWFKAPTWSNWTVHALTLDTISSQNAFYCQFDTANHVYCSVRNTNNSQQTIVSTTTITPNQWYFVTLTYDGANLRLYLNGASVATPNALTGAVHSYNQAWIGSNSGGGLYFTGNIDEMKIYPYARTAAQVQADYNSRGSNTAAGTNIGLQSTSFLNNGLVGYWKMDEATWSGTASEVVDSSGNGKNGTAGGPTNAKAYPTAGKFGNAGFFDGVDNYVSGAQDGTTLTEFTYSLWFNTTTTTGNTGIFQWSNTLTSSQPMAYLRRNGANISAYTGGAYTSSVAISQNTWYLATVTYKNNITTLYLNGQSAATLNSQLTALLQSHGTTIYPGNGYDGYFSGLIDDVRIYNRALSPSEVSSLYSWAPGPVGYWKMDERKGTSIADSGSFGTSGTFAGTPTWVTGKFGSALNFAGTGNYATIPLAQTITNNYTIEGWTILNQRPSGSDPNRAGGLIGGTSSPNGSPEFITTYAVSGNTSQIGLGRMSDFSTLTSSGTIPVGTWAHVAATVDSSNQITYYINGINAGTANGTGHNLNLVNPVIIGDNAWRDFRGSVDDVKIYNYVRTQQQVVEDMNGGHPTGGSPIGSQVGYWKMDEGNGQTVNNSITGGINGTLGANSSVASDDPTWTTSSNCKVNGCLSFDGSNDYVNVPDDASLKPSNITVSAWVYPKAIAGYATIIMKSTSNAWTDGYGIANAGGTNNVRFFVNNYVSGATPDVTLPLNTWSYVVGTYDGSAVKIYLNGVLKGSTPYTTTMNNSAQPLWIARGAGAGNNFVWNGYLDEVKLYNSALTQQQILVDYNAGAALNFGTGAASESASLSDGAGNPPIAYWDFEERRGTALNDKSGNNYSGTWQGTLNNQWTTGKTGSAGNFNGTDNYVDLPASSVFLPSSNAPITVEGWFKPTAIGGSNYTNRAITIASGPTGSSLLMGFDNTNKAFLYSSATATRYPFSANAVLNQWTHLAVTFNGTQAQLYRDGKTDGAAFALSLSAGVATTAKLGTVVTANGNWFAGQMDEVKIYNYARTASQIAYDVNRGAPVGWWQFDECQGSTLHDASGNGNDGTWAGGTSIGTCTTPSTAWGNGITGKYNSSLAFNSTNSDYVNIPDNSSLRPGSGDWAMAYWFKAPNSNQYGVAVGKRDPSTFNQIVSGVGTLAGGNPVAAKTVFIATFSPLMAYRTTRDIADGNWHHVVAIRPASGTPLIYIDGKSEPLTTLSAGSLANINNTTSWKIGWDSNPGTDFFNGQIDDVRVFNYVLSPTQVKTLFNGGAAVKYGPLVGQP